jgi:hypothetical protein
MIDPQQDDDAWYYAEQLKEEIEDQEDSWGEEKEEL